MTKGNVTTLSVGITEMKSAENLMPWNLIGAGTMFLFLPTLFLFLILRKYIMQAITLDLK